MLNSANDKYNQSQNAPLDQIQNNHVILVLSFRRQADFVREITVSERPLLTRHHRDCRVDSASHDSTHST